MDFSQRYSKLGVRGNVICIGAWCSLPPWGLFSPLGVAASNGSSVRWGKSVCVSGSLVSCSWVASKAQEPAKDALLSDNAARSTWKQWPRLPLVTSRGRSDFDVRAVASARSDRRPPIQHVHWRWSHQFRRLRVRPEQPFAHVCRFDSHYAPLVLLIGR